MKGAGGGKRGGRKPTRVESDDRPRGYEATRMRQLWRDIDNAKHKAGLVPTPVPAAPPPSWDVVAMIERATALVGEVAAWMTASAPTACAALASSAELLRGIPLLGRLVDLVPSPRSSGVASERGHTAGRPDHHANGFTRPTGVEPGPGPDGGWVH
jgi:hypothetical protein